MATQREVADRAGVSFITVSRVINGLDNVRSETRSRVEAAIKELNYHPNSQAQALNHGLRRLRDDQFPLSLRLISEFHGILLRTGRGSSKQPGEFRRSQNWIGGTRPGNGGVRPPSPSPCHAMPR